MTVRGTGRASLENAVARAKRRAVMEKTLKYWSARKADHIRDPDAYQKVVEENKRLGIPPMRHRTLKERIIKMNSSKSRRSVSLSGQSTMKPKSERELAEGEAINAIKDVIEILQFHLSILVNTPNPASPANFKNRVNQTILIDAVRKLGIVTQPNIPTEFSPRRANTATDPFGEGGDF